MIIWEELVDILVMDEMIKREFEDAEIVVIDIGPSTRHIDLLRGWERVTADQTVIHMFLNLIIPPA